MSPDRLGTALHDLVDDVEEGLAPPEPGHLWAGGRRRRTARLVPVLAAGCLAALLVVMLWPTGVPQASVPAVQPDGTERLTSYPSAIPLPRFLDTTTAPGVTAAFVPVYNTNDGYAVSPAGVVTELRLPSDRSFLSSPPALSPDGRWLARGPILTNLTTGDPAPSSADQLPLVPREQPPPNPQSWWSPDSQRLLHEGISIAMPRSAGVTVGIDGSSIDVPLVAAGVAPVFAGWLDEETLLGFVDVGSGTTVLQGRTWRIGDDAWQVTQATIPWPSSDLVGTAASQHVGASLSPDRSRLLMTVAVTDPDTDALSSTQAMMFDPATGRQLGMPLGDDGTLDASKSAEGSFVEWEGWGCRPAWHNGLPVVTDGGVRGFVDTDPGGVIDGRVDRELVAVSGRYDEPCVAVAGDELRGTPVENAAGVRQERLFVWGWRFLLVGLIGGPVWWLWRQRRWSRPDSSVRPIFPGRG